MLGWAFAAALLAFPLSAWLFLWRSGIDRQGAESRGSVAVLATLAVAATGFTFNQHGCLEGSPPLLHYLVALPAAGAVYVLGKRRFAAACLAAGMCAAFLLLLGQWTEVVHSWGWTGNPGLSWHLHDHPLEPWRRAMGREAAAADEMVYPAGWLEDSPILRNHPEEAKVLAHGAQPAWPLPRAEAHTVLTGLYAMRPTRIGCWYPGGRLRDALARIEVRTRE